jgi:hypothetical protein
MSWRSKVCRDSEVAEGSFGSHLLRDWEVSLPVEIGALIEPGCRRSGSSVLVSTVVDADKAFDVSRRRDCRASVPAVALALAGGRAEVVLWTGGSAI